MAEVTCPNCAGKGQVVQPELVWDSQKGEYVLLDHAGPCKVCGGKGTM